ncbi:MAG: oligoendopeptidase F [Bacillota bacterium]|nr:oligoendopeptidase F [Bacillota bacterium]
MQKRLTRAEVPVEMTWDLTRIFPNAEAWEAAMAAVEGEIGSVTRFKGKLGEGASTFLACLEAQEELHKRFIPVASYASLHLSADGTSSAYQASAARVGALSAKVQAATSFIQTEALALPGGTLERYLAEEPGLTDFRRTIELLLEQKPHVLGPETEVALASLSEVLGAPQMIYNRSKSSDMTFDPITDKDGIQWPMSFAVYEGRFEKDPDPVLRRNAYASFTKGLRAYKNTFAATWATEVKKNVVVARLRGYKSATDMILAEQEVTEDVYNGLHDIILKELAPHMRRYVELRKRVLGLDKILYCDIEAPLDPEYNPETTYEQASETILRGISVLGPEYAPIIDEGLRSRWIDLADNIGKSTGAFCSTVYGVHPYILITWTGSMRDALVLAHELGHAGQGVLALRYQRLANTRGSRFFSEAPSTINELLVAQDILDRSADRRMRRWVIMQLLATYYHNFVRHLIEGELQRRTYVLAEKGRPLTEAVLSKVQGEILEEFWGGVVEIDDGARLTWMRQPHYYMGLYPYTYSAGLTIGTAVAQAIREEGRPAVDRWLEVLKIAGTKKPLERAAMAGVDMTRPDAIRKAVAFVGSLIDEVVEGF